MGSNFIYEVIIRAKDEATKIIAGVEGQVKSMQPAFAGMAAVGTAAFVGIGAAAAKMVGDARESAKVMAQTEAVIRSTGGAAGLSAEQIAEMSGAMERTSLFTDEQVQSGQNLLLTFTNIGKDVFPQASQAMVDMAQAMGSDASSGAIQLGKALNDPTQGITALTRVGVSFTEEQKKQIEAMQKAGNVAGAQKLILAELSKEFGGSALAARNASGPFVDIKNDMDELSELIGGELIVYVNQLGGMLQDLLFPVIEWIKENPKLATTIGLVVAGLSAFVAVAGLIGLALPVLMTGFAVLTGPIGLVILAIGALVAAGVYLWKNWDEIKAKANAIWTAIVDRVKGFVQAVTDTITGWGKSLLALWNKLMDGLHMTTKDGISLVLGIFLGFPNMVVQALSGLAGMLYETARAAMTSFLQGVTEVGAAILNKVSNIASGIKNSISDALSFVGRKVSEAGSATFNLVAGARAMGGPVSQGQAYLVGERGPELFVPGANGTIIPNAQPMRFAGVGGAAGGGGGVSVMFDFRGSTLLDERTAVKITDLVVDRLKRVVRIPSRSL